MTDTRLRFGDPSNIAYANTTNKSKRDRLLSHPHGFEPSLLHVPKLSQEDFDKLFGPIDPISEVKDKEIGLQKENGTFPEYEISPMVIMHDGWYGDPETIELGRVGQWTRIEVLSVRRPEKDKGPAPSWKVREVNHSPREQGTVYFIGRRGKYFIGETPESK